MAVNPLKVAVVVLPVMVAPPGVAVTVQLLAGRLLSATLPVANAHVGEVIVPIVGVGVWFTVIVWVAVHPSSE